MNIPENREKPRKGNPGGYRGKYKPSTASKILKDYKPTPKTPLTFGELLAAVQDELNETKNLLKLVANG